MRSLPPVQPIASIHRPPAGRRPLALHPPVPAAPAAEPRPPGAGGDVEVSVRCFADGRQITVMRRTVGEGDRRLTVGIEALVR